MEFFQKVKKKIDDGFLQEFAGELRWLWQYIRRYRMTVVIHILLGVLGILMGLGSSVASKYLIDAVTGYKTGTIGLAASLMVGMQLGNIAMRSISSRVGAVINIRVQNEMQAEVYRRILATDWESVERFRSGDLLNRLNSDASGVASGVTSFIPSLISSSVQFLGAFAIIAYYDPTMAVLALLGVPVSVLASRVLVRRMRDYNREMKGIYSDLMSFHEDSFQNITSIKAFGITGLFDQKMDGLLGTYRDAYLRYNQFSVKTTALMSLMGLVVSASCFGWGVYRLWTGAISYGSMTMFLQLASSLGSAFSTLIGLAPTAISISTSAGRIMAVVELPAEDATPDKDFLREGAYSVDLRGVTFRYQGGEPVLRDADVTAQPGDLVALTGPSGEGKTTLLRILLGLAHPTGGEAALIGASGKRYPISAATRGAFGYVPQGNSIFAGTIADNLRLTKPDATDAELETVLKAACAYDFVKELPGGMQYVVGGRGKGLSEGQAQRIAVARALLRGAPILLLDEATSALDEDTEERMLRNLMEGGWVRTCILVTHRPGSRKFCTRGYRVRDGRVEAC
ncbi:MAG: ABC transporter ATP-binding protein [Butyricicoccus sp.]|nr:ABC transporter ATP-binding protein [Butyricicoccus sp.]